MNIRNRFRLDTPDRLKFGLELEIEHADPQWADDTIFNATEDGSLRNSGWEFVSPPMDYEEAGTYLKEFFRNASNEDSGFDYYLEGTEFNYSERTSVHVHSNVGHITMEQLKAIILLYQVTESLLFSFIGNDRDKNIFCVPWTETALNYNLLTNLDSFIQTMNIDRNKYTALNLVPVISLGTIEWRHMHGNCDVEYILTWLRIISRFYTIAEAHTLEEIENRVVELNTTSQYRLFVEWLFGAEAPVLQVPGYQLLLEDGVLHMKYMIISKEQKKNSQAPRTIPVIGEEIFQDLRTIVQEYERINTRNFTLEVNTTEVPF